MDLIKAWEKYTDSRIAIGSRANTRARIYVIVAFVFAFYPMAADLLNVSNRLTDPLCQIGWLLSAGATVHWLLRAKENLAEATGATFVMREVIKQGEKYHAEAANKSV